jgi:hypothetical protein
MTKSLLFLEVETLLSASRLMGNGMTGELKATGKETVIA